MHPETPDACPPRLLDQDLMRIDSARAREIQITLVEGFQLLGSFDVRLREYAAQKLHKQGVHLVKARALPAPPGGACTDAAATSAQGVRRDMFRGITVLA